jgi:hypothetical protein
MVEDSCRRRFRSEQQEMVDFRGAMRPYLGSLGAIGTSIESKLRFDEHTSNLRN